MAICHSCKSLCTWTIVALFTASAATGCASGTGDPGETGVSSLSGGGGVTPKGPKKTIGGKSGKSTKPPGSGKGSGSGSGGGLGGLSGLGGGSGKTGSGKGGSGKGGSGKSGGSGKGSGSGGKGSGGKGSKGYAFVEPRETDHRYGIDLQSEESRTLSFTWNDVAGVAPPADLSIETDARTLLQVSSTSDGPFARADLTVIPIEAGETYRIVVGRKGNVLTVSMLDEDENVLLQAQAYGTQDTDTAVVVLPGEEYRASVACEAE